MIYTRRTALTMFATALAATGKPAFAAKSIYFIRRGLAIGGYDPVAYFTDSGPVKGSQEHSLSYGGATWLFKSAKNKALFKGDPTKYEPMYGGYCAYAMARGAFAKTEPDAWRIYKGKLYLNYDLGIRKVWDRDKPGYIKKANRHWPNVRGS